MLARARWFAFPSFLVPASCSCSKPPLPLWEASTSSFPWTFSSRCFEETICAQSPSHWGNVFYSTKAGREELFDIVGINNFNCSYNVCDSTRNRVPGHQTNLESEIQTIILVIQINFLILQPNDPRMRQKYKQNTPKHPPTSRHESLTV